MAEEKKHQQLHIAVFPWLAFGHMIPFLELSKQISEKGHRISFLSTPRNISRLHPKHPLITFVPIPLPSLQNLPQGAEATTDLSVEQVPYLKQAYDLLAEPLTQFLEAAKPDCIIYDFAPHWLPPIAAKLGLYQIHFFILCAASYGFLGFEKKLLEDNPRTKPEDFTSPPKWVPFPTKVAFKLHEAKKLWEAAKVNDSGVSDFFRSQSVLAGCDLVLFRSCLELEEDYLSLLGDIHRKPVLPVGLLPPVVRREKDEDDKEWLAIEAWMEGKPKGSVVYVGFGSEATLSQGELTELATGLELSGLHFFWAFKKKVRDSEFPDGFQERTKGRGLIWTGWAPQVAILSHGSVGGFLTHGGWSSVIEGLAFGRPLIMFPMAVDQGLIARVLEDKMVGREIPRDEEEGSFTSYSVAETLKLVLVDEKGKIYRDKAVDMMNLFGDKKIHDRYVDELVDYVMTTCRRP